MSAYKCVFLLTAIFQVSLCKQSNNGPPVECFEPIPGAGEAMPHTCCNVEPLIPDANLEECGFQNDLRLNGDCSRELCILRKFHVFKEDEVTVDFNAVSRILNKWGERNPGFEEGVELAKSSCLKDLPGPDGLCQLYRMYICQAEALIYNCPKWEDSEECMAVKTFMAKCNHYFV